MKRALAWLDRRQSGVPALALAALAWELAPRCGLVDGTLLPPLSRVLAVGFGMARSGLLARAVFASLWRVGLGYGLAVLVAVPLGIALGLSPRLERHLSALLQVLRPISPPAWVPLAILWFGIGDAPAVFIIFVGTAQALIVGVATATRSLDARRVEAAFTLGANRWQALRWVILPGLSPALFGQLRVGLALAWMCVVAAEMVAVRSGLGYLLIEARNLFQTERVLLVMLVIGALGVGFDRLLHALEVRALAWRQGTTAEGVFERGGEAIRKTIAYKLG